MTTAPRSRRILFVGEPPEVKIYSRSYLEQFGTVIGPVKLTKRYSGRHILMQSALAWHYGINWDAVGEGRWFQNWSELQSGPDVPKAKLLSVICSNKRKTRQQRKRLQFVEALKTYFGEQVEVFGRGFRAIGDKAEAIAPFKYHIVLENNVIDHFWTEKLADAYLGDAFPIYSGGGSLSSYFPDTSFATIDITRPAEACRSIAELIDAEEYEQSSCARAVAKRRLMQEHNFFAVCDRVIKSKTATETLPEPFNEPELIKPPKDFPLAYAVSRLMRTTVRYGLIKK